jgi:predicted nucleotide-binding protein
LGEARQTCDAVYNTFVSVSVFFSYSHADKPVARRLTACLSDYGFRVWIDEGELSIGDSIIERVAEALDEVDFVAALVSEHSVNSAWCRKELSLAMTGELARRGVKVLPLRLGNVSMPATLKDKFYLDVDPSDLSSAGLRSPVVREATPA